MRSFAALLVGLAFASCTWAADLAHIDRTIAKEPAYRGQPKYCLLVFGPQAKFRVWLVQDGDTLYVDRNGNGDLTEPGKKVTAEKQEGAEEGTYYFKAGDIHDGPRLHRELAVYVMGLERMAELDENAKALHTKNPKARGYSIQIEMELFGWKGTGTGGRVVERAFYVDANGVLQFADRPQDAPVINFGGPLQATLFGPHRFTIGRETDVVLGVGSPGVGPGTTAWVDYEGVMPEKAYPTLDIAYPAKQAGEPPIQEHLELKRRC